MFSRGIRRPPHGQRLLGPRTPPAGWRPASATSPTAGGSAGSSSWPLSPLPQETASPGVPTCGARPPRASGSCGSACLTEAADRNRGQRPRSGRWPSPHTTDRRPAQSHPRARRSGGGRLPHPRVTRWPRLAAPGTPRAPDDPPSTPAKNVLTHTAAERHGAASRVGSASVPYNTPSHQRAVTTEGTARISGPLPCRPMGEISMRSAVIDHLVEPGATCPSAGAVRHAVRSDTRRRRKYEATAQSGRRRITLLPGPPPA